ncbi:threonine synthase [Runella slithyformis]|uniref:Threonine synthase n=1 Tax=Runella slithyformis (strain ATCC 29530 / DSM 19594 / LMG 11500 / NCIMB 11436 / LSU 4) TaxID=761193 RepID=A0A7U4E3R4_RUNSL|nr:threonine synthase [Runella slithyformis]AEI46653.1 threonine synthase [Runella slithyformis DSM 19594]
MILYSTKNRQLKANLEEAVFRSLPADNGLYMPEHIPTVSEEFLKNIDQLTFNEIAFEVSKSLLNEDIPENDIRMIVERAFDFDAPVVPIEVNIRCLELFHGPSMAFKDFGARFMASLMSYFLGRSQKEIHILVATSGDTGGAVAQGFHNVPGISVTILYPKGKVSDIQEKQLTTLGGNVTALEVEGTFDDCQALVKQAFLDKELTQKYNLASANSINISRLIPQSFYYFRAYAQVKHLGLPVVFSVPSGNFGNLSAGILAHRMGLPVDHFVAVTNRNNVVPKYLENGAYTPSPSVETVSNAMDVGNPSNFVRLTRFFDDEWSQVKNDVSGFWFNDEQTKAAMQDVYERQGYLMCPHTAVAYLGLKEYMNLINKEVLGVFLSTAHYAKFLNVVEDALGTAEVNIPTRLSVLLSKTKESIPMSTRFEDFKNYLLS